MLVDTAVFGCNYMDSDALSNSQLLPIRGNAIEELIRYAAKINGDILPVPMGGRIGDVCALEASAQARTCGA